MNVKERFKLFEFDIKFDYLNVANNYFYLSNIKEKIVYKCEINKENNISIIEKREMNFHDFIDSLYIDNELLLYSNYQESKIFVYKFLENKYNLDKEIELNSASRISAVEFYDNHFYILDKNFCALRIFSKEFEELEIVGSRVGYRQKGEENPALGFEFPESMFIYKDKIYISDSGNKSIVVLNNKFEINNVIYLPFHCYKFLDINDDFIYLSGFGDNYSLISQKYGFLEEIQTDFRVNYLSLKNCPQRGLVLNEEGKLIIFDLEPKEIEECREYLENNDFKFDYLIQSKKGEQKQIKSLAYGDIKKSKIYLQNYEDASFKEEMKNILEIKYNKYTEESKDIKQDIHDFADKALKLYKSIPQNVDDESMKVNKLRQENFIFTRMNLLKEKLRELSEWKNFVKSDNLFLYIDRDIKENYDKIISLLNEKELNERDFLYCMVNLYLLFEERTIIFKGSNLPLKLKFFPKVNLSLFINRFYFYTGEAYYYISNNIEKFKSYASQSIRLYPSDESNLRDFINHLINLREFEFVKDLIDSKPVKKKMGFNLLLLKYYKSVMEYPKALLVIKDEIVRYKHRTNLIPQLLSLDHMTRILNKEEREFFISKLKKESIEGNIDNNYNLAQLYKGIADYSNALLYVNKELNLYPNNENAISLKIDLVLEKKVVLVAEELEQINKSLKHIKSDLLIINKIRFLYFMKYFREAFDIFCDYLGQRIPYFYYYHLFEILSIDLDDSHFNKLSNLYSSLIEPDMLKEVKARIDFHIYCTQKKISNHRLIELNILESFFASYSSYNIAYNYFLQLLSKYIESNKIEEFWELVKLMLKYFPGDKKLIELASSIN